MSSASLQQLLLYPLLLFFLCFSFLGGGAAAVQAAKISPAKDQEIFLEISSSDGQPEEPAYVTLGEKGIKDLAFDYECFKCHTLINRLSNYALNKSKAGFTCMGGCVKEICNETIIQDVNDNMKYMIKQFDLPWLNMPLCTKTFCETILSNLDGAFDKCPATELAEETFIRYQKLVTACPLNLCGEACKQKYTKPSPPGSKFCLVYCKKGSMLSDPDTCKKYCPPIGVIYNIPGDTTSGIKSDSSSSKTGSSSSTTKKEVSRPLLSVPLAAQPSFPTVSKAQQPEDVAALLQSVRAAVNQAAEFVASIPDPAAAAAEAAASGPAASTTVTTEAAAASSSSD